MERLPAIQKRLLLLLLPLLVAWRPYETPDGTTTATGLMAIEWGAFNAGLRPEAATLTMPQLLVRLGLTDTIEVGLRAAYRDTLPYGGAPFVGSVGVGDLGAYGKWVLLSGGMQNRSWARPSIAVLGGVQFLTEESLWSAEGRAAGSLWIGPVVTHVSLGFRHNHDPGILAGAVVAVPMSFGLTPAIELSGQIRFSPEVSVASIMLGATYDLPGLPISIDLAARRGLTSSTPDWTLTTGLTMHLRLWRAPQ